MTHCCSHDHTWGVITPPIELIRYRRRSHAEMCPRAVMELKTGQKSGQSRGPSPVNFCLEFSHTTTILNINPVFFHARVFVLSINSYRTSQPQTMLPIYVSLDSGQATVEAVGESGIIQVVDSKLPLAALFIDLFEALDTEDDSVLEEKLLSVGLSEQAASRFSHLCNSAQCAGGCLSSSLSQELKANLRNQS